MGIYDPFRELERMLRDVELRAHVVRRDSIHGERSDGDETEEARRKAGAPSENAAGARCAHVGFGVRSR